MRRAGRIDDNHTDNVRALRCVGCAVISVAGIGRGVPDLIVRSPFSGRIHLLEVKDGRKPPSRRTLTPDEARFHAEWPNSVTIVLDVASALAAVGATSSGQAPRKAPT